MNVPRPVKTIRINLNDQFWKHALLRMDISKIRNLAVDIFRCVADILRLPQEFTVKPGSPEI